MEDVPSSDLAQAAKRLGVPLWGRLLIWGLSVLTIATGAAYWHMLNKLGSIESAVRVLASKQPTDVNGLVKDLLEQAKANNEKDLQQTLQPVMTRLQKLDLSFKHSQAVQMELKQRVDGQQAIAKLLDPGRVLATIRAEIDVATTSSHSLPQSQLVEYRNAVKQLPSSAHEYWATIAAIINYQSLLNQMSGEAPDPAKVSRPCFGLTNSGGMTAGNNSWIGGEVSTCIVDLDGNSFRAFSFVTCVVRYHNGGADLQNVRFVNCRFIIDPPTGQPAQAEIELLDALLDSVKGTAVRIG